ncbi:hypothetical protein H5P28_09850 [Ruficoccus amylovorans]|uniref:Uncharacterized protein n=1 Tax=Ruficoccus amylovorans TaxID=1804625 RepID=A0A842HH45_9BACT|nr:hypothetical protein [Ruficoccus amylovorans]MBC2594561.1 hypothetical protein [Ruficoccus amylovorans]
MKTRPASSQQPRTSLSHRLRTRKGSMIMIALLLTAGVSMILGSVLDFGMTEKKNNSRHILHQEAKNAAESFVEYGFADLMDRFRTKSAVGLVRNSLASDPVTIPASATSFYNGSNIDLSKCELVVGEIPDAATEVYIDPTDPSNEYDPLKGKRAYVRRIEVLGKAVATTSRNNGMSMEAYAREVLEVRDSPLFAHAIFYNMDLELHPGPQMNIYGPVHTNKDFWVESTNGLKFYETVSCAGRILHGYKLSSMYPSGALKSQNDHTQQASVQIVNSQGAFKDMYIGGSKSTDAAWLDHRDKDWRSAASQRWDGYVQDTAHGVPVLNPVGIADYVPLDQSVLEGAILNPGDPDSRINVIENHAYALIEPVLSERHPNYKGDAVRQEKYAYKAGLILRLERTGDVLNPYYPTGTYTNSSANESFPVRRNLYHVKAYKYERNSDGDPIIGTDGYPIMYEVRLPKGLVGAADRATMREIDKDGELDLYYTQDEKDDDALVGTTTISYTWVNGRRVAVESDPHEKTNNYNPLSSDVLGGMYDHREDKPLDMLSINVERLCELVDNTNSRYNPDEWKDHYGPGAVPTAIYNPSADWNGIIYVQFPVDTQVNGGSSARDVNFAASGARARYDNIVSGTDKFVALQVISASKFPSPTYAEEKGLTIATNGPLYTIGNINANGRAHTNDANLPDDSSEPPGSFASDTLTVLSNRWYPDSANNRKYSNRNSTSNRTASYTEFSAAILTGLKPTIPQNSPNIPPRGAISGGAHNFPRFLENWNGELTIRGSLVALFESEVHTLAMPNDSGNYYDPPDRDWGFNENFRNGNYPPGTPNTRTYRRVSLQDIPENSKGKSSDPDYQEGYVQAKARIQGSSS